MSKRCVLASVVLLASVHCDRKDPSSRAPAPAPVRAPTPAAEIQGRRVDVQVTMKGYIPDTVPIKSNEQITLVFTRTEPTECGAEIAIPSLLIKKALPMNVPVAIPFRTDKAGDVVFACGMNMMHGLIEVRAP